MPGDYKIKKERTRIDILLGKALSIPELICAESPRLSYHPLNKKRFSESQL